MLGSFIAMSVKWEFEKEKKDGRWQSERKLILQFCDQFQGPSFL